MASSLVFLGIGVVMFFVIFGFLFQLTPAILGAVFTVFGDFVTTFGVNAEWTQTYNEVDALTQYLVPLIASLGIVVAVIKVIMVAGGRGND